jgi:hypothetical protein
MKRIVLNFIVVVLFIVPMRSAFAAPTAYNCQGCTEAQYRSTALSRAPANRPFVYIYDFANNNLRKFEVSSEPTTSGGQQYFVDPVAPSNAELTTFSLAQEIWSRHGRNTLSLAVEVDTHVGNMQNLPQRTRTSEAYGVLRTSAYQTDLFSCIKAGCYDPAMQGDPVVIANFRAIVNEGAALVFKDHIMDLKITVTMDNGSQVVIDWKPPAEPVVIIARDANGNAIPPDKHRFEDPSSPYGHDYDFSQDHADLQRFIDLARAYGAIVRSGGSSWRMSCGSVSGSPGYTCQMVPR